MIIFRSFAFVLSFLLLSASAFADAPKGLGVHLGLNFADVSMDSTMNTMSTTGWELGTRCDHEFAPNLFFSPGLQLIQRGFGVDIGLTEVDLKMTYLELPLLFQARFTGAPVTPYFLMGPVLGLKLGTSCSTATGGDCGALYDKGQTKSTHMGLDFGGGVIFPLESGSGITAELRYHLGLTKITDGLADAHHRGLLIDVGYLF
ncbi:MAG: PorT family protein [Bdellovibrionales bacterium]|nr:PorT family protein [Bdellovibrionales bacterium]